MHTLKQKKTVVCEFLDALAEYRFKNVDENAELSIVRVLVGDCNLERQVAEDCTQGRNIPCSGLPMQCSKKGAHSGWRVISTMSELQGGMVFVTGAVAKAAVASC